MYYFLCSKRQAFRVDCLSFALCGLESASKGGVGKCGMLFAIIVHYCFDYCGVW